MSERTPSEGKVKLTESGAKALSAWAARSGVTLVALGEVMRTHAMAASRALRRQGCLTLEQVGQVVAYSGGELTAEMLVGLERAPGIPRYPLRQRTAQAAGPLPMQEAPAAAAAPSTGGSSRAGDDDDDGPPSIEELRRLGRKGLRRLEMIVDSNDSAATAAAESAHRLVKSWIAAEEAERERAKGASVKEVDLIEKFNGLLYNARRQAEEAEKAEHAKAPSEESKP